MANFRITKDMLEQNYNLDTLSAKSGIPWQEIVSYVDKYGEFPEAIKSLDKDYQTNIASQYKLPSYEEAIKNYINTTSDISNITDEDLSKRIEGINALKGLSKKEKNFDRNSLVFDLFQKIKSYAPATLYAGTNTDAAYMNAANYAADSLMSNQPISGGQFSSILSSVIPANVANQVWEMFSSTVPQVIESSSTNVPLIENVDEILQQAKELQSLRSKMAEESQAVNTMLAETPEQLAQERERFFSGQRKRAIDYLGQEYDPYITEKLGARGLADSGERAAFLASKYGELESSIQSSESEQLASDIEFFADQAYKKQMQDLIQARTFNVAEVESKRQNLLTTQSQGFQKRQADIESKFNLDLFKSENERALKNYQALLDKQQSKLKQQNEAALTATIAKGLTTGAGAALMASNPVAGTAVMSMGNFF